MSICLNCYKSLEVMDHEGQIIEQIGQSIQ